MSENAPKISVIVPMYNAEKYLSLCITSILAQTFKDFELILIDDCSTDKTLEVAKSFSDSRIKILQNKKNLGMPGTVRNVGIDAARGEYLFFCDDDDVILANGLEVLLKAAEEKNADAVNTTKFYNTGDFKSVEDIKVYLSEFPPASPVSEDLKTRIYEEFLLRRMHIAPWLFLYKRKFLLKNNIKFPDEVAEDVFFNFDVVCATDKIVKIDIPFYIHRKHFSSATFNPMRITKNLQSVSNLIEHIEKKLSPINDVGFTRLVLMYWTSHVIGSYILPFVNDDVTEISDEISEALKPRFGKNFSFVLTIFNLYLQSQLVFKENQVLNNKINELTSEKQILQSKLANIEQILKA